METTSSSLPWDVVQEVVNILEDLKRYPIKPSFGGKNYKQEEVMSFLSIMENFILCNHLDVDKIKVVVIFLHNKARV